MTSSQRNASCQPQIVWVSTTPQRFWQSSTAYKRLVQTHTQRWCHRPSSLMDLWAQSFETHETKVQNWCNGKHDEKSSASASSATHRNGKTANLKSFTFRCLQKPCPKNLQGTPYPCWTQDASKENEFTLLSSFRRRQVAQKAFLVTGLLLLTLCCDRLLVFGSQLAVLCIYALLDKSLPAKEKGSSYSRRCDLVFWWQHLSTFWGLKLLLLIKRIKTFSAALEASLACMCHWVLLKWEQQKIQICMQRTALKLLHFHCVHCVHCVLHPGLTNVPQLFLHMQLQLPPPHSLNLGFDNPNQEIDLE